MKEWLYYRFWIGIYEMIVVVAMIVGIILFTSMGMAVSGNLAGNVVFLLLALVVMIPYALYKNVVKGRVGEYITEKLIKSYCEEKGYKHIYDLEITNNEGGTSQIDHLVITDKGIAVIETKFHMGRIYGSELDKNWTYIYRDKRGKRHKKPYHNPIRQNYGHIQALKELLNDETIEYFNIVSFLDTAILRKFKRMSTFTRVIYTYEIKRAIEYLMTLSEKPLKEEDMKRIYEVLSKANITDREIRKEHIQHIQNNIHQKKPQHEKLVSKRKKDKEPEATIPQVIELGKGVYADPEMRKIHIVTAVSYLKLRDINAVAKERNLTPMIVQEHIVQAYKEGFDIHFNEIIPEEQEKMVVEAIDKVGRERLKAIKDELPEDVGYLEIKLVLAKSGM